MGNTCTLIISSYLVVEDDCDVLLNFAVDWTYIIPLYLGVAAI
jgi:hypothetical protein